jgi:hypothetical protein
VVVIVSSFEPLKPLPNGLRRVAMSSSLAGIITSFAAVARRRIATHSKDVEPQVFELLQECTDTEIAAAIARAFTRGIEETDRARHQ